MLVWCSYCQRFLSEKPPLRDFSVSHGVCVPCSKRVRSLTTEDWKRISKLTQFQKKLYELSRTRQFSKAMDLIKVGVTEGIREVDILVGFLAPLLFAQSEDIPANDPGATEEISQFVLRLIETLRLKLTAQNKNVSPEVLFAACPESQHTLGVQMLELWLSAEAITARSIWGAEDLILAEYHKYEPKVFGLWIAEFSQLEGARRLINKIKAQATIPPLFLVGGSIVTSGEVLPEAIPEACLILDSEKLFLTIKTHLSLGFLYDLKSKGAS